MIVVRREDVAPGGRYAGGRFAPPVPDDEPRPRAVPSAREFRERAYQRIQDEGYLRAQRQADPQAAAALATADVVDGFVAQLTPILAGFAPQQELPAPDADEPATHLPSVLGDAGLAPETDRLPGDGLGATQFDEGEVDVAGLPWLLPAALLALRLLVRTPKRNLPTRAPQPRVPTPWPAEPTPPAPRAPAKPDRPLAQNADQVTEPLRDALREDRLHEDDPSQELVRKTIRDRVAEKFQRTTGDKIEIDLEEIGLPSNPRRVIREFADLWRNGELAELGPQDMKVQLNLGRVNTEVAERIESETGRDVADFMHVIESDKLQHALKSHGPDNEVQEDHIPIDEDSISLYLQIVSDPENFIRSRLRANGTLSIEYEKVLDGRHIFVELVGSKRGTLSFKTHWIEKE